jgi:tetratricopeptide (TPR) repeat protein
MARTFRVIISIGLVIGVGLVGWWLLPQGVSRLPNSIQQKLPHTVRAMVSTPLPTALPAPEVTTQITAVSILPSPTATSIPTKTAVPAQTAAQTSQPSLTAFPTATPKPTNTPLPSQAQIEGLVIDPQGFNNCGPANLSIVLAHHGYGVDQDQIGEVLRPAYEDKNVSPTELTHYVNEYTPLKAMPLWGGNLNHLKQLLAAGYPVIIEEGLLPSEWEGWMGHYLTLYGYDDSQQTFISLDTYLGPWDSSGRTTDFATLTENWNHFNNAFLVVYPPEAEADLFAILGEEWLEPLTMWQHSAEKAQTAVSTNPDNAFNWFNLGSSLTHLAQLTGEQFYYDGAVAAFDQARAIGIPWRMMWYQFEPYAAYLQNGRYDDIITLANATIHSGGQFMEESYFYRGQAMQALGKEGQAQADFTRVLEINPNGQTAADATSFLK